MVKVCKACGEKKQVSNDFDEKNCNDYYFVCTPCFDKWIGQGNGQGPIIEPLFQI